MSPKRSAGASRSLLFTSTLLLSAAVAVPAMAQIEEVVVTAQKRTEDVQNVPIAVTAFTGQDLKTQQIEQFKDLQFHAPNVNYTAGNFGGADFSIRGIGVTAVGYDAESGVAIDFDEVYLAAPQLTEGSFYDLGGLEVLAGPQSTLYGRGATGGVVNININKPDLETAMVQLIGDYGNYNHSQIQGVVNLPIIDDQLAIRIAGDWDKRDGFVTNLFDNDKVDGLNQYSVRGTVRWQPSDKTTVDITGQFSNEDDNHMRADKQLCTSDPTGVLGCLPGSAGTQPVNSNGTAGVIFGSQQALTAAFSLPAADGGFGLPLAEAQELGAELGLANLQEQATTPPGYIDPSGARQVDTDFTPRWHSQDNFLSAKWTQSVTPWLQSTLIGGWDYDWYTSNESYNNIPGAPLPYSNLGYPGDCGAALGNTALLGTAAYVPGSPNINCAAIVFPAVVSGFATEAAEIGNPPVGPNAAAILAADEAFGAGYASHYAQYFSKVPFAGPGELPESLIGNLGLTGGNYTFSPYSEAFDQSDGAESEVSAEWRWSTSFSGPFNAMLGFYYLHTHTTGDYYVNSTTLDYPGIVLGALAGAFNPACSATGCILSPSYYHNIGADTTLTSKSVFGEVYYDLIPDTLKLTGGLRLTNDDKFNTGRIIFITGLEPIGDTNEAGVGTNIPNRQEFTAWTGRAVVDWTPKLPFTDQTLVYASYSTGYKAGGANPNVEPGTAGVPATYSPENIISYEIGTKNMLLGGTLQANGDVYYYNYGGLQVSTIQQNTSVNDNIAAHVWGAEGNFIWQATDHLQLGLNLAHEQSDIVHTSLFDPENPTKGDPNTLLIKDDSLSALGGQNCVLYYNGPGAPPIAPLVALGFFAPPGGEHALAAAGIPNVAYGSCNPLALDAIAASGLGYSLTGPNGSTTAGVINSLDNHSLQNTPDLSINLNAQYIQPLPGDYALTLRTDFHWQSHFWGSIFEDGANLVRSEHVWDASLQINPPDSMWYAQAFIKNITNENNITGIYVTSQTSGLYSNAFLGDPRTYGIELGVKFE